MPCLLFSRNTINPRPGSIAQQARLLLAHLIPWVQSLKATQWKAKTIPASEDMLSFSSELKVKMLVHLTIILTFLRNSRLFSKSPIVFWIPIMCKCPNFHIPKQHLLLLLLTALCWGPRVNSLWVCYCSSLVTTDAEHCFICWQSVCTSLEKYLFRLFAYFSFL